jgi:hypothetical protein
MDDVDRRRLLLGSAATLALMPPSIAATAGQALMPASSPARVGRTEVDQVETSAAAVSSVSFAHGGDFAVRAGLGQLQWAYDLLSARCSEHLRPELFGAVSRLAGACAFAAFDALDVGRSRGLFDLATACAVESGDADLLASALGDAALLAIWVDDPRDALAHVDQALAEGDGLSATARAMLYATAASAHGRMADSPTTLRKVDEADDAFAGATPGDGWLGYYGRAEHVGTTADALYHLSASTGHARPEAIARFELAAAEQGQNYARSRMLTQTRRAILVMRHGDPDEGAAIGNDALDHAATVRSARAESYFRVLHHAARAAAGRPAVDDMRRRVADALLV